MLRIGRYPRLSLPFGRTLGASLQIDALLFGHKKPLGRPPFKKWKVHSKGKNQRINLLLMTNAQLAMPDRYNS